MEQVKNMYYMVETIYTPAMHIYMCFYIWPKQLSQEAQWICSSSKKKIVVSGEFETPCGVDVHKQWFIRMEQSRAWNDYAREGN